MIKIISIIGARPHFMKMAPLSRIFETANDIEHIVIHSGQHYDEELSGQFVKEFGIKDSDYNLSIGSGSPNYQIGKFLLEVDVILIEEKPDLILVYGDTNTTAAGAIAAAKNNIALGHVEAGLREWDKSIPEEINKLLTDAVTDLYFCPTESSVRNLKEAGITDNVHLTGDITLDLLVNESKYLSEEILKQKFGVSVNDYVFFTCHRQNNCDNLKALSEIVDFLNDSVLEIVWPVHPRMKNALKRKNLEVNNPKVFQCPPISYWETQSLIRGAKFVVTDSGGVTKEAYFHKTNCIVIDVQTEWLDGLHEGWMKITGPSKKSIDAAMLEGFHRSKHTNAYGTGDAAKNILLAIRNYVIEKSSL